MTYQILFLMLSRGSREAGHQGIRASGNSRQAPEDRKGGFWLMFGMFVVHGLRCNSFGTRNILRPLWINLSSLQWVLHEDHHRVNFESRLQVVPESPQQESVTIRFFLIQRQRHNFKLEFISSRVGQKNRIGLLAYAWVGRPRPKPERNSGL